MILIFRVGLGYDVHAFAPGRALILGGVNIPYERGLLGHSDADVLIHALMDAMLGALALGDIGKHFPDTDERYRGISSVLLLKHVQELLSTEGYTVGNLDSIIVAQKPKLAPYIPEMRTNLARALDIDEAQVSVKATTTERLGFEGREEGISAQALILLLKS
ncbi:2-C-methyl-D-erythritol 2,4-cyclodiphosphate synthase [Paradesulfitobacterium aromaticivorans]